MSTRSTERYRRSCPICHTVWLACYMNPVLVCSNPACRKAARERGIPVYKFIPWQSPRQRRRNSSPPDIGSI